MQLKKVRDSIKERESQIKALRSEIEELNKERLRLEKEEQEEHFRSPVPGDFWHEMYTPFFIVLAVEDGFVTICDKTKTVYEEPDKAMVLRSYESPDDPEVKAYFAKPRKDIGYTFDVEKSRRVSRSEFDSMLKCYSGALKDELAYRCEPRSAERFVPIWLELKAPAT